MSWADILIQMARYFPAFVARDGTQNLPMIGLIRWGWETDVVFDLGMAASSDGSRGLVYSRHVP
jgi:hypothetical protein